jgi:spore maturation protein CgeB
VKASGAGVFDDLLESGLLALKNSANIVVRWDVDAPANLIRMAEDPADPQIPSIPRYDAILTSGGGEPVIMGYKCWGARECLPVYNALDPNVYFPVDRDSRYVADVAFLGDRLPDRESRVDEFLLKPAATMRESNFLLAGSGWEGKARTGNVRYVGHVRTEDHNAFHSTPRALLSVTRECEAECGYSPPARIFEAAGAGACIVTDAWEGIAQFFEPGEELYVAKGAAEVVEVTRSLTWTQAEKIGQAARQRALWEHTYTQRAQLVESFLGGSSRRAMHIHA